MATEQTILFTVMPRGISLNSATKPVSVFVSPRLDGADKLDAFPDWLNWTRHLRDDGLKLELYCGANTQTFSINGAGLRPDLWKTLQGRTEDARPGERHDTLGYEVLMEFLPQWLNRSKR